MYFLAGYLSMTDSVNAGADDMKRAHCGSKLE